MEDSKMKIPLIEKTKETLITEETPTRAVEKELEKQKEELENKKKKSINAWGQAGD